MQLLLDLQSMVDIKLTLDIRPVPYNTLLSTLNLVRSSTCLITKQLGLSVEKQISSIIVIILQKNYYYKIPVMQKSLVLLLLMKSYLIRVVRSRSARYNKACL